jgi:hypothetical protein
VAVANDIQAVFDYIDAHQEEFIERLWTLCQQPSVAAQVLGMQETAATVAEQSNTHVLDRLGGTE